MLLHLPGVKRTQDEIFKNSKNVRWLKNFKKEHELSAVDLKPSMDNNKQVYFLHLDETSMQNVKIYAKKGEIKIIRRTKVKV